MQTIAPLAVLAALISATLARALRPLLVRYALARPNARSSHRTPTPQGGGIAVLAATILALTAAAIQAPQLFPGPSERLVGVLAAAAGLAVVGAVDDIHPIQPILRLLLQVIAAAVIIVALPAELRVLPMVPYWLERALMLIGLLWLVNLVNFMDGIDLMTVAEVVPVTAALALFGWRGVLPPDTTLTALALCGAMLGFAPFNKPVAKLFLGDVGSLPIGLLLGWLLILLAERHLAAALLLPLYYLADATTTLLRRLFGGERIMQAHRSHFYQQAVDKGMGVYAVVGMIFGINIALGVLAGITLYTSAPVQTICATAGAGLVGLTLRHFARS